MPTEQPKRSVLPTIFAGVVLLPVVSVLSLGPGGVAQSEGDPLYRAAVVFYWPLEKVS